MIETLKAMYGTVASYNVIMQNFIGCNREEGKGCSFQYQVRRGIDCGLVRISPHNKHRRSLEAFEGSPLSWVLKTVMRFDAVFV